MIKTLSETLNKKPCELTIDELNLIAGINRIVLNLQEMEKILARGK